LVRRSSLVISLVADAGVIFMGVLQGIIVAIVLAVLLFFKRNWWPHGRARRGPRAGRLAQHHRAPRRSAAARCRGVPREAPLFFASAGQSRNQVRKLVVSFDSPAGVLIGGAAWLVAASV
jgi:MFS superfamily sulfate permease-like transporter